MDHHDQMKKDDSSVAEFTLAEMVEMNYLFEDVKEESISRDFCEELAESFSGSTARAGKSGILWEQVQEYFQEKLDAASVKIQSSLVPPKSPATAEQTIPSNGYASSEMSEDQTTPADVHAVSQMSKDGESHGLTELAFEGKSLRDCAWYDVASFLAYRYLCTGELEVRVRFSGFQKDHDEWLSVKRHVRERSIPLEASECHKVNVGDTVLCFQERADYAVYCDARILEVQKRLHDEKGCRCIFLVRFDHDRTEERVDLTRLCCRPK